jgi:hypothetical protein
MNPECTKDWAADAAALVKAFGYRIGEDPVLIVKALTGTILDETEAGLLKAMLATTKQTP